LQDEEFKVAYYILNRLALEDTNRVKIYRAMLADLTGKSERTISRITDKLDEKGIIKKDTVSDSKNRYNYYSIHTNIEQQLTQNDDKLGHEEQETTPNLVTDDRFNKKEKKYNNKRNKEVKESKKVEVKKTFPKCEVEETKSSTVEDVVTETKQFAITCSNRLPDEMNVGDYLRAIGKL
jgi:DNA-binding Lrp family transcriptional regulator